MTAPKHSSAVSIIQVKAGCQVSLAKCVKPADLRDIASMLNIVSLMTIFLAALSFA